MKTLYLVRHAKSSWKYPNLDDFERPLNKPSPANRAAITARIIAAKINYPLEKIRYRESIYEFSEDALIHVIKQIDDSVNKAMIVGHNPATNGLANYIGDQPISNIPTCGVFCVELDISSWAKVKEHCGKLKFFEFPKKHTS
jgi:phosphohistidine phosphatase